MVLSLLSLSLTLSLILSTTWGTLEASSPGTPRATSPLTLSPKVRGPLDSGPLSLSVVHSLDNRACKGSHPRPCAHARHIGASWSSIKSRCASHERRPETTSARKGGFGLAQAMLRRPDAKQRNLDSITACSGFVRLNRLKLEHKESP